MKNKSKKVLILAIIAFFVASPVCGIVGDAYAADPVLPNGIGSTDINKIHDDLGEEAFAQLTWHILYKCVKGSYEERDTDFKPSEITTNDDFFDYSRIGGVVTIPTGYYLEAKVQGGTDYDPDGAIYCRNNKNKILRVAADALNYDYEQILCDSNSPGIIRNRKKKTECNPSSKADDYQFNPSYETHLKNLWNKRKISEGWATTRESISYYGGVNGYVLYSYEAGTRCGNGGASRKFEVKGQEPNGYFIKPPLETVGQDGGIAYQYFTEDNELENTITTSQSYTTCSGMISRANSDTIKNAFREKVLVTFNDRCKNFYQNLIDTQGDRIADDAKAVFEQKLNAGGQSFLEDKDDPDDSTDNQDKQCVVIDGILHPTQTDDTGYADDATQDVVNVEPTCYDQAGSLGWILCPLIDTLGEFILEKYEQWIVPALEVDAQLFSNNGQTYESWKIFRDIANIAFVILFIFVIFSQITGVGIDNYGIKKVLPKVIVGAILNNTSYIICQLAIDIFNIVGHGIGGIFKGISNTLTVNAITLDSVTVNSDAWDSFTSAGGANFAIVAIVAAAVTGVVLTQGLAIIVPILLLIISIAFAVFALIAMLGIRQALAVILVVFSPLAFVCYMLPNTKSIFDKWFKMFKGLLIAFPICSAIVYGGDMVGKILLNSAGSSTWLVISSAIISVAPIFFIPKLITQSLGALGAVAARLQTKGAGMARGAAGRRLEHSALTRGRDYRRMSREQAHQARTGEYNYRKGQKTLDKLGKKNVADMSAAERARYRAAQGMVGAENRSRQDMYAQSFSSLDPKDIDAQVGAMTSSGKLDANMATAAIESIGVKDQGKILKTLQKMSSSDAWKKMTADDRSRVSAALLSQKDNAVAQAYGKMLGAGKNISLDEAMSGVQVPTEDGGTKPDSIASRLSDMDASVLSNQDKDTLSFIADTTY